MNMSLLKEKSFKQKKIINFSFKKMFCVLKVFTLSKFYIPQSPTLFVKLLYFTKTTNILREVARMFRRKCSGGVTI